MALARVWTVTEAIEYHLEHLTNPDGLFDVDRLILETIRSRVPPHILSVFEQADDTIGHIRINELTHVDLFKATKDLPRKKAKIFFRILYATLWFALTDNVEHPRFKMSEPKLKRIFREAKALYREALPENMAKLDPKPGETDNYTKNQDDSENLSVSTMVHEVIIPSLNETAKSDFKETMIANLKLLANRLPNVLTKDLVDQHEHVAAQLDPIDQFDFMAAVGLFAKYSASYFDFNYTDVPKNLKHLEDSAVNFIKHGGI